MCLAVPARIVSQEMDEAVVDLHGNQVRISTMLTPEVRTGDWVLVHAGFAIQHLSEEVARQTWSILDDLAASQDDPGAKPTATRCGLPEAVKGTAT
ncbi:MAG: HypC/HybG/HupF family hydrogenase formation chaperone [Phycisphaeraceae bacterium]|nr:HypC/HybG/HupF family hydrogenase formation chaperone [Phycisphaeraceae bacterium]